MTCCRCGGMSNRSDSLVSAHPLGVSFPGVSGPTRRGWAGKAVGWGEAPWTAGRGGEGRAMGGVA